MKIWDKGFEIDKQIERFTVGNDRILDALMAKFDVLGSLAHIKMLNQVNLLTDNEHIQLKYELIQLYQIITTSEFTISSDFEDIHSFVEHILTEKLGDIGKKIHTARSRNDQVLLDIKLFLRDEIEKLSIKINELFHILIEKSEESKDILMPGYTHFQAAMVSSFGMWFGAYAESLVDDMYILFSSYKCVNQNPLGSAAGFGSSMPINRELTTELLGFETLTYNSLYCQISRGKVERTMAFAISSFASTLSKLAMDICLYNSQNYQFIKLPDAFTTGSSIMPHKKNPDVFELIRAKCNKLQAIPAEITFIINNLPSGYHRDFQIIKETLFPSIIELNDCLDLATYAIKYLSINTKILDQPMYNNLFSVEEVNKLVTNGVPFRDSYKKIGAMINENRFNPEKSITHTHIGSIGNLCNDKIEQKMNEILHLFEFNKINDKLNELI